MNTAPKETDHYALIEQSSYPVKKKRQPRRLSPNWAAIVWLESEARYDTEVIEISGGPPGLVSLQTRGSLKARIHGMYPRRMFDVFDLTASSTGPCKRDSCPDCDDWSRTAHCEEHHDRDGIAGLQLGYGRRRSLSLSATLQLRAGPLGGDLRQWLDGFSTTPEGEFSDDTATTE